MIGRDSYRMPREPIAEAIEEHFKSLGTKDTNPWRANLPTTWFLVRLAKKTGRSRDSLARQVRAIRSGKWSGGGSHNEEAKTVDFDLADAILCVIDKPMLFYTDPRLHRVYSQMVPREGRPMCACHGEEMSKSGFRLGKQQWRCAIVDRACHAKERAKRQAA